MKNGNRIVGRDIRFLSILFEERVTKVVLQKEGTIPFARELLQIVISHGSYYRV